MPTTDLEPPFSFNQGYVFANIYYIFFLRGANFVLFYKMKGFLSILYFDSQSKTCSSLKKLENQIGKKWWFQNSVQFLKRNAFLTCSWRFLRSDTLEQLGLNLKK